MMLATRTCRRFRRVLPALVLSLAVVAPVRAGPMTVSPAMGGTGTVIKLRATGLGANTNYLLEFVGNPATPIGTLTSDASGVIYTTRTLGTLPTGTGKLRLKTTVLGGTVVANSAFTALAPLAFVPPPGNVHAGQRIRYSVTGLAPGTLTLVYESGTVVGPVAVSGSTYSGQFAVPADRPATLPANARIRVQNKVGNAVVNELNTTLAVQRALTSPFSIGITQPPPNQLRADRRFPVSGTVNVANNEPVPERLSLWYFGDNGEVLPLGSTDVAPGAGQSSYQFESGSPGFLSMTAAQTALGGRARIIGNGSDSFGRPQVNNTGSANDIYAQVPSDRWQVKIRVVRQDGTPIQGAIVQVEGAPVLPTTTADPGSSGSAETPAGTLQEIAANSPYSQLRTLVTDAQGCPLTLARRVTDANGEAVFQFEDSTLAAFTLGYEPGACNAGGGTSDCLNFFNKLLRVGIDASAQGYGFQVPAGEANAGDFMPHIYLMEFTGTNDDSTSNDVVTFYNFYRDQDVPLHTGGRSSIFTQQLPAITPRVGIYDTTILPWAATSETLDYYELGVNDDGVTVFVPVTRLNYGPIYSRRGIPNDWIPAGQGFPTQITVRTDPAVSQAITSATLFLNVDRSGGPEFIGNFSSSPLDLDCSIDGLDKALTWRANLPANLHSQASGPIDGFVEFIGSGASGRAKQQIRIDMRERDVSWLNQTRDGAPVYSERAVNFPNGAQNIALTAVENTPDASTQLPSTPCCNIGRLANRTDNTRLIEVSSGPNGDYSSAPLDGSHLAAGRAGDATLLEAGDENVFTLIDQSYPLFYYVWGVPLLAGIEVGANVNILAEISIENRYVLAPNKQPLLEMTTTPSLDLGLNFYLDLDVLFDLVDGGVDVDAVFYLDMPVRVRDGVLLPDDPDFDAALYFSWHFEVFCLPLDVICDALNDIEGCERLLPTPVQSCAGNGPLATPSRGDGGRVRTVVVAQHTALAYAAGGGGLMALTRPDPMQQQPPSLVARQIGGGYFGSATDEHVLSTAPGIRSLAIAYYDDERALAVWAESADSYATLATRTPVQRLARQRLMYALWDGDSWAPKAQLTAVSGGEGGVALAACTERASADCPAGGEVLAVWTRDMAGDLNQHRTRIYSSRFGPVRGWTTPQPVDGSALLDSAPSATYVAGTPVVAFVRSTSGVFADTAARRVAYRYLQAGSAVQVPAALPGSVAWPSIVALPAGGFAIVHTHADDPDAFVGNTQRAALAYADACSGGSCSVVAQAVTDANGRPVYGERPTALLDADGNLNVVMRGTGFGIGPAGEQNLPLDSLGMAARTGELIGFTTARGQSVIAPQALSADGAVYYAPTAAYDPELRQVVATGTRGPVLPQSQRALLKAAGIEGVPARAAATLVAAPGGGEPERVLYSADAGVDFAIESVTSTSTALNGGNALSVSVRLRNVGAAYVAGSPSRQVLFSFDKPRDAGGIALDGRIVPSLQAGEAATLTASVTVPAGFTPDETHRLYAQVAHNGNPVEDVNEANDSGTLDFGGMPMVFGLQATPIRGTSVVQLLWDDVEDPWGLVAGYRIWCHDGDGRWKHLGSSFERGFIDLLAPLGVERSYRVTSYSAKAIESPPSSVVTAKALAIDGLFANGFE